MAQTLGYVRVSTQKQELSVEAQTARIRAMVLVKGWDNLEILTDPDEWSGSLDRPAMADLLARVDAGTVAAIIVTKLDRLTRDLGDLCGLLKLFDRRGVSLVSLSESLDTRSASGLLVVHVLGAFAEYERKQIGERTRDGLHHKRDRGERIGTLPFGFQLIPGSQRVEADGSKHGGRLEPAPVEQRILAQMRRARAEGRTYKQIAVGLTAGGFTTRRGTPWGIHTVAHLLKAAK
ncbi:MAG: recombinase family protein [Vicinamibacterales bacterium]